MTFKYRISLVLFLFASAVYADVAVKKTEKDAKKLVDQINEDLPGIMELEYEGFYPAGIFVSAKEGQFGAKKKYALIKDEKVFLVCIKKRSLPLIIIKH